MVRRLRHTALKRAVGLLAAYAFALQMLLAGIVATQMAAAGDGGAALCFATGGAADPTGVDGTGTGVPPGAPHTHPPCAVCVFASLAPPLPVIAGLAAPQARAERRRRPVGRAGRPVRRREPRSSRGPPRAA